MLSEARTHRQPCPLQSLERHLQAGHSKFSSSTGSQLPSTSMVLVREGEEEILPNEH